MTTIAWDGTVLAADTLVSAASCNFHVTKIARAGKYLLGAAGDFDAAMLMMEWFLHGAQRDDFPSELQKTEGNSCVLLVIVAGEVPEIRRYDIVHIPTIIKGKFYSVGSGSASALAAMHCGKNAIEAVQIAHMFDCRTGDQVETLTF